MITRLILALCFLASLSTHAEDFRLLSFNIRYANPKDGLDGWENRREAVARLIREEADLAGLQEVLPAQRAEIAERCAEFGVLGVGREVDDKGEASPILFRKERFEALASGTFWLSDTPETPGSHTWGNNLPRVCTWAKLRDVKSGAVFFFFNTHLDHESQPSRERAVQLIVQRMQARGSSEPVVLGGDFNVHHDNPAFAPLAAADDKSPHNVLPLISAYVLAGIPPEGTFHAFTGQPKSGAIDFFFVEHDRWKLRELKVLKTTYAGIDGMPRFPSDHFPIRAVIEMVP
jgi:endonuclease/exonuclease/phosphatase family metal-dependent hydrolase